MKKALIKKKKQPFVPQNLIAQNNLMFQQILYVSYLSKVIWVFKEISSLDVSVQIPENSVNVHYKTELGLDSEINILCKFFK